MRWYANTHLNFIRSNIILTMTKLSLFLVGTVLGLIQLSSYIQPIYSGEILPSSGEGEELEDDWTVTTPPPKPFNPLMELTEANYDETIDSNEFILVEL